jgi:diguanylate cyclase (GGDEF)-like protein
MARGGRVHWFGRLILLGALFLPWVREGHLTAAQLGLTIAAMGLVLTSGRLTRELNNLLGQARWDADHDDLTGVLARSAFRAVLEGAAGHADASDPVSLLLIDLDGFGRINKTVGHASGDALLASVGAHLRSLAPDACVGRLGGDEFAMIIPNDDPLPHARHVLDTLPLARETSLRIAASAGIARAPRDGSDAESLLKAADIALRVAKRSPRDNEISLYAGGSLSGTGTHSARASLAKLIAGDGLTMMVQPILDLRTGWVYAYEALARFGERGQDSPLAWFALAEELGEHDELERACLRASLELLARRPLGRRLAVNLSAPVLLDRRTMRMLEDAPDLTGLIIEITEETLAQNHAQLHTSLLALSSRGVQIAVDDVGAGYSGLSQIATVHPSYLKLDRSLVSGLHADSDRAALVGALVSYADRVGSLLIAEGVERDEEVRALLELEVPLAQGFRLGRPAEPWPFPVLDPYLRRTVLPHARPAATSALHDVDADRRARQGDALLAGKL